MFDSRDNRSLYIGIAIFIIFRIYMELTRNNNSTKENLENRSQSAPDRWVLEKNDDFLEDIAVCHRSLDNANKKAEELKNWLANPPKKMPPKKVKVPKKPKEAEIKVVKIEKIVPNPNAAAILAQNKANAQANGASGPSTYVMPSFLTSPPPQKRVQNRPPPPGPPRSDFVYTKYAAGDACAKEPLDGIISGLTPPTACQLQNKENSIYEQNRIDPPELVQVVDPVTHKIPAGIFPPVAIARDPNKELIACTLLQYPCKQFKEIAPTWNNLDDVTYRKAVKLEDHSYHTSSLHSEVKIESTTCNVNGEFKIHIQAKDHQERLKLYGGDFINVRTVQSDYPNYKVYKNDRHGAFAMEKFKEEKLYFKQNIVPGHVVDNKNGTYEVTIPCKKAGKYRVQVFLMYTSETTTALEHMFRTLTPKGYMKGRFLNAEFKNGQFSEYCDPWLPDQLPGGDISNVCPIFTKHGPKYSWYCERPPDGGPPNKGPGKCDTEIHTVGPTWPEWTNHLPKRPRDAEWHVHGIGSELGLKESYADLMYKVDVEVLPTKDSTKAPSHNKIPGHFDNGIWIDRVLPHWAAPHHYEKKHMFDGKIILRMGDSILRQMWEFLFEDIKRQEKARVAAENEKGRRKRRGLSTYKADKEINERESKLDDLYSQLREMPTQEEFDIINDSPDMTMAHSRQNRETAQEKLASLKSLPLGLDDYYTPKCIPEYSHINDWPVTPGRQQIYNYTITFTNYALPYFYGRAPHCAGKAKYTPDLFKRMIKHKWFGKKYIVTMDHGPHMTNWHPIILWNRLVAIKEAAIEYKKHSPDTPILYKTIHFIRGGLGDAYQVTTGLTALWQRDMVFRIFGNPYLDDMRDDKKYPVKVFDCTPFSMSVFDFSEFGGMHPETSITRVTENLMVDLLYRIGYFTEEDLKPKSHGPIGKSAGVARG